MGLPSEERVQLRQSAELHDIGKLAIPFDPAVVDAFSELVVELAWPTAPAPSEVSGGAR